MIQFIKTREVKNPVRDITNAGIDIYIPENTEEFRKDIYEKNKEYHFELTSNYNESMLSHDKIINWLVREIKYSFLDNETGKIYIAPHKDIIIPSGIRSKFGPELALIANNKSGIATKKKLVFGASVIDSNYEGEWHVHLINTSDEYQVLECGQKVVQFIPHLISTDQLEILDMSPKEFYKDSTSTRGEGWQGSTGLK